MKITSTRSKIKTTNMKIKSNGCNNNLKNNLQYSGDSPKHLDLHKDLTNMITRGYKECQEKSLLSTHSN